MIYNILDGDSLHYRTCRSIFTSDRSGLQGMDGTLAFAYPNLIVMFRSISFLKRIVWTPEIAFTTVDFPWATCPMVPILIVACLRC
jgi:hypothetical protein